MAMIKQQPPQLPLQQPGGYLGFPTDLQMLPGTGASRSMPFRYMSRRPRLGQENDQAPIQQQLHQQSQHQLPQQYAQPLSRPTNHPFNRVLAEDASLGDSKSEHLLRRKTPNGTLNGAYDGTSVEQMERPHPTKHILLSVSEHFSAGGQPTINRDMSLQSPHQVLDTNFSLPQQHLNSAADGWNDFSFGNDLSRFWKMGQPQQPQMDSVLNQMPSYLQMQYPNVQLPFGFVPQPLQPSFVPTAGHVPGPYGPYWPNGAYQPYQPAATRDLRFYPQHTTGWTGFNLDLTTPNSGWHHLNRSPPGLAQPYPQMPLQYQSMGTISDELLHNQYLQAKLNPFASRQPGFASPPELFAPIESGTPNNVTPMLSRNSTPTPQNQYRNSSLEYGPALSQIRDRESIFQAAVDIYIDLVKHLHKTRAHGTQHRTGQTHQVNRIFPKPPRLASGHDLNQPRPHRHHSSGSIQNQRPSLSSNHRHSMIEGYIQSTPYDRRPKQSPMHQSASPPISDRITQLRRGGNGSDVAPGVPYINRQEHYPVQNAVSALDSLTVLCQESGWKWVDGLLLGGSLAYALADYSKAYEWYSKILNIDNR